MNIYDSERLLDILKPLGYAAWPTPDADLIILNTCHIREKATDKVYADLGRFRRVRQERATQGQNTHIIVAGCVAQAEGEALRQRAPYVDWVVGPQNYHRIPEFLSENKKRGAYLDAMAHDKFLALDTTAYHAEGPCAFVTVQEGCDKFCTYCTVPYVRGAEYSRRPSSILQEVQEKVSQGVKEITFLGQNVNAYHGQDPEGAIWSLARLICEAAKIPELKRIRYMTSHPRNMDDDLIEAHRDEPKLMPYLHLPVQSGADRILKAMNRQHTREFYLQLLDKITAAQPSIVFSSDFIVGFPGETDEDFADTLSLIEILGPLLTQAYSFSYSPRPGTPAAPRDNIPPLIKKERLGKLQERILYWRDQYYQKSLGTTVEVLFDKEGRHAGQWVGRTPHMHSVWVDSPDENLAGQIRPVTITRVQGNSLSGHITPSS